MRAYVLGAGASYPIYPLGSDLFSSIDQYIQSCGPCFDRFDYKTDWPKLTNWLGQNSNPLLKQAYQNGNIEQIFTVLDLAESLILDSHSALFKAAKAGMQAVETTTATHDAFLSGVDEYRSVRRKLLWALEAYFLHGNERDAGDIATERWNNLKRLGKLLEPGDVVITFNYDCTVERVLLGQSKWTPSDGYGTQLVFQKAEHDKTPVDFSPSLVKVLHLHGAIGWYSKPTFRHDYDPSKGTSGPIERSVLSPAPLDTEIALDPLLLRGLGIHQVDASLPHRPPNEEQIMLHPSFLKEYGGQDKGSAVFTRLWKSALEALKSAEEVTIIGYSLPAADSAAWTLLHTGCDRGRTVVVNPNKSVLMNRYASLLRLSTFEQPMSFGEWLDSR